MLSSAATISACGTTTYHHHDGLGSVIMLTNVGGSVVKRYRYDVFGHVTILDTTHATRPATAHNNRFLFTGREWLAELELYDSRNRTYCPMLGRFLQTDPIQFDAGDVNLYRYVANNPVNWSDSTGQAIDTFVDLGLILNDLYNIFTDPCNKYDHLVSLSLNSAGLFLPFATGLGATYKAAKAANRSFNTSRAAMRQAKRDAGIPTSQTHNTHRNVPADSHGGRGIEYTFDGGKTIQNHYQGHRYPDGGSQGPNWNNHPSTKNHYYYP